MSMWKRAFLSIRRRKVKSLILFLIMLIVFSGLAGGAVAEKTMTDIQKQLQKNIGLGFVITGKTNNLKEPAAKKVFKNKNIKKYNFRQNTVANLIGAETVQSEKGAQLDEKIAKTGNTEVAGSTDSALNEEFVGGLAYLKKGRQVKPKDKNVAVVNEKFASKNKLAIGRELQLKGKNGKVKLKVIGIYKGEGKQNPNMPWLSSENTLFTDISSVQKLSGKTVLESAEYFVSNPKLLKKTIDDVKKADLPWSKLELKDNSNKYADVLKAIDNVKNMITIFVLGLGILSIVILSLVMIFRIRGRMHEIGVLISLGNSRGNITGQILVELGLIAVISLGCAIPIGNIMARSIGTLLSDSMASEGGYAVQVFNNLNTYLDICGYLKIIGIGMAVTILSVLIAMIPILKSKPKDILSKLS